MVSSKLLTGVLAMFAANGVNAGPCRPSSSTVDITATADTTTAETSAITVGETLAESLTGLSSTETATADGTTETLSVSTETLAAIDSTTTEEPTSTVAASTTTSAAVPECATNADCDGATPFCDVGTCVATDPNAECSTNADCNALHGSSAPFCTSAGNCVGCRGDGDCYGETPYCDGGFCNDYIGHIGFGR
ncbi:uncharacterized protein BKA55DRAFT_578776 [Fusarium redolens]|uniref:Uncharacterized protein n=1 Tax=Fusarium redolens TaxID=48865 RepID=A0A9P9GF98_FUSRE|nr:uncharacterized protein BKA55DRAFT_578776 [Fusarium redolens]KAH7236919.1 hypothetical protein BKA55DRAFT_578776 [Fusarium redolens]